MSTSLKTKQPEWEVQAERSERAPSELDLLEGREHNLNWSRKGNASTYPDTRGTQTRLSWILKQNMIFKFKTTGEENG